MLTQRMSRRIFLQAIGVAFAGCVAGRQPAQILGVKLDVDGNAHMPLRPDWEGARGLAQHAR